MFKQACVVIVCLGGFIPATAFGLSGKGTTAASFMKLGVGSRAIAMGEAYAAVADDASAVFWNPAGLIKVTNPQIMAMHIFWLEDIYVDQVAAAVPLAIGTAGASLVYLNSGSLARSNPGDTPEDSDRGQFLATNLGFSGAYSYPFSKTMSLGGALELFSENIDSQSNLGWALNLGFLYTLPWPGWDFGAQLQNLGPASRMQDESFRLPINFKLGVAYTPFSEFKIAMDYNQLLEQKGKLSLGGEYIFEKILALRIGYFYQEKIDTNELYLDNSKVFSSGFALGLGIHYRMFLLDYTFVPYGFFGTTHRIAITYNFTK